MPQHELGSLNSQEMIGTLKSVVKEVLSDVVTEEKIQIGLEVHADDTQIDQEGKRIKKRVEKAVNPIEIRTDVEKGSSKDALTKNLAKSFEEYNRQVSQSVNAMTLNGTKAAYNYYTSFNEAMEAGVDKDVLNQYMIGDGYRSTTGDLYKNIGAEIDAAREKLESFLATEKTVEKHLDNAKTVHSTPAGSGVATSPNISGEVPNSVLFDETRLKEAFDKVQEYTDQIVVKMGQSGTEAAQEYYKAYEEAIKAGAPKDLLDKYLIPDTTEMRSYNGNLADVITNEITVTESVLKNFAAVYEDVTKQIGADNISEETEEKIRSLVEALSTLDKVKNDGSSTDIIEQQVGNVDKAKKDLQDYLNLLNQVWAAAKTNYQEEIKNEKLSRVEKEKSLRVTSELMKQYNTKKVDTAFNVSLLSKDDGKIPQYREELAKLQDQFKTAGQIIGMTREQIEAFMENLSPTDVENYENEIDELAASVKKLSKDPFFNQSNKYGTFRGSFGNIDEAKRAFEELSSDGKTLSNVVHTKLNNGIEQFTRNIVTAEGESQKLVGTFKDGKLYTNITRAAKQTNVFTKFTEQLADRWRAVLQYVFSFGSFYQIWGWAKQGVQVITELDSALTEMRKVSDESLNSLKEYADASFDIADAVGTTSKQLQASTADFMRIGESMEEAAESAKAANVLLNVSEFDSIDEATESLIAMSAAFDDLSKTEINDVLNNLGKQKLPKRIVIYGRNFLHLNFRNRIPIAMDYGY